MYYSIVVGRPRFGTASDARAGLLVRSPTRRAFNMKSLRFHYGLVHWSANKYSPANLLPCVIIPSRFRTPPIVPTLCLPVSQNCIRRIVLQAHSSQPPVIHDEDSETEMPRKTPKKSKAHIESTVEADVHAKDQLKDELMEDIEANEGAKAAKEEKTRISPTASNAGDEENGDSDEDDEEA